MSKHKKSLSVDIKQLSIPNHTAQYFIIDNYPDNIRVLFDNTLPGVICIRDLNAGINEVVTLKTETLCAIHKVLHEL